MNPDIDLFIRFEPDIPTLTHQNGIKVRVVNGHPQVYKSPALCNLEAQYCALLKPHAPKVPWSCPIFLTTHWMFRRPKNEKGRIKTTKPDCSNLIKTLEDCMTRCGFWKDDALIFSHMPIKFWADANEPHGIFIHIRDGSSFNGSKE